MNLHERIAKRLGWSLRDVTSMSLLMLRELVRDADPALAREITQGIKSGAYVLEPAAPNPVWTAYEVRRSLLRDVWMVELGSFRARNREEAEEHAAGRWHTREIMVLKESERPAPAVRAAIKAGHAMVARLKPSAGGGAEKPAKKTAKRSSETFVAARARILRELAALGWETRPGLKFPWAKHPHHSWRVNFKAQAVYLDDHSMFIDIRGMPLETFMRSVTAFARRR